MVKLSISYDPYRMKTAVLIDDEDVSKNPHHKEIETFIKNQVPLQTWISKQEHNTWEGLLSHLIGEDDSDKLCVQFCGRGLDYNDLKRTLEAQNASRDPDCRVTLTFREENPESTPDDQEMMRRIDEVVKEMQTDKFNAIVNEIGTDEVKAVRDNLRAAYATAKNEEFQIVFAGIYSSGKSSIINTLMRHMVLPMADKTKTTRVTRIYHNNEYGSCVKVVCKNNSGSEICSKLFDTDEDCMSYIDSLPVSDDPDAPDSIDHLCLYVDLSHLYPETNRKEMMTRFKLVLVDTPGSNSAVSTTMVDGKYHNQHKEIALRAIQSGKEIVILCASYNNFESEDMGKLLQEIHRSSREKNGGFNDRFLFVINQCDNLNDFDLRSPKESFANFLRNPIKLQVPDTYLNPRIFLTTAKVQELIQRGVPGYSEDERETDSKKDNEYDVYNRFRKQVIRHNHWLLAQHCDLPEYRKAEMQAKFNKAKAEKRVEDAVSIQTGIPCLEVAIQDYLERYAYPLKIRDLLDPFDALLEVVSNFTNKQAEMLAQAQEESMHTASALSGIEKEEKNRKATQDALGYLQKRVDAVKYDIDSIKPSSKMIENLEEKYTTTIDFHPTVRQIRYAKDRLSPDETKKLLDNLYDFLGLLKGNLKEDYAAIEDDYIRKINICCDTLTDLANDMKKSDLLRELSKMSIKASSLDPESIKKTLQEEIEKTKSTDKQHYTGYSLWTNLVAAIKNIFGPKVTTYNIDELKQEPSKLHGRLNCEFENLKKEIASRISKYQSVATHLADAIAKDIVQTNQMLEELKKECNNLKTNESGLETRIHEIKERTEFLDGLHSQIASVASSYREG